jgi:hypothetical protein
VPIVLDIIDIIEKKRLQRYGHVKGCQRREGKEDVVEKHGWKEYKQP